MRILDQDGAVLYKLNQCKEIYVVNLTEVEVCFGKSLKNNQCRTLGKYEDYIEARGAFEQLVEWLNNPGEVKVFKMPYEMPREARNA